MTKKEREFIETVKEYYRRHKRRGLPWRKTKDPYHILVSEIMLQQTQVDRVVPKYELFLRTFPTVEILAKSPLSAVLRTWQGLGYNRRAKMLHETAKIITRKFGGRTPTVMEELEGLPGLGRYTAGAVMAFAWNIPVPIIETNIRSVYLYHFFEYDNEVSDKELMPVITHTLDMKNPRAWYYALMDYGSFIKKMYGNPSRKSKHHTRQSTFKGSDREIRGAIVRLLGAKPHTRNLLLKLLKQFPDIRVDAQLHALQREGLITQHGTRYSLAD
jgi:A/G-specific adenine glycosylase